MKGTFFLGGGGGCIEQKYVLIVPATSDTFLILRRINQDIVMNVCRSLRKVPIVLVRL